MLNFGRNVGANASRLAEDIAGGWNEQHSDRPPDGAYNQYSDGQYSEAQYPDGQYSDSYYQASDNDLDQGWQPSDRYGESPTYDSSAKRTYGESLYGSASSGLDGAYPADDFDDGLDDVGPDDVYEADYRVIEPPKTSLGDINPNEINPNEIESGEMNQSGIDKEYRD